MDVEAAAFPRLTFDEYRDLVAVDFRYGFPLTCRRGPLELKFSFCHLSSHLADEFILSGRTFNRLNFVRDALVLGLALWPTDALRLYAESGWAFHVDGGSEPWQFQFGADFSPAYSIRSIASPSRSGRFSRAWSCGATRGWAKTLTRLT